ncbi:MAG TPA: zinc ribbon domain-containing protein [Myxococcales bacterium]|nr:zinc ribbon domain-containing protein [Myxococcales bacterium]
MKYCTECGAEYQDSAQKCSDCEQSELVSREEMRARNIPLATDRDTTKFVPAGSAEDPLTQETLVKMLEAEKIPVFPRQRSGGSVDMITGPSPEWWELLVPEDVAGRARLLIDAEKEKMKANEEEAGRAAEEEAGAGGPGPSSGS